MSNSSPEQFYQEILQDPTLQGQLKQVMPSQEALSQIVELAANRGFNFNAEELEQWLSNKTVESSVELSDDQLESVAGGSQKCDSKICINCVLSHRFNPFSGEE